MKILVVEDDPLIAEIVRKGLENESHVVDTTDNGTDGSFMGRTYDYDVVILDHSLPGKNGIIVCKDIKGSGRNPAIIFLSMTGDVETKVLALENGADDYMTKPFSISELCSRIRAVKRRHTTTDNAPLKVHDLSIDPGTHRVIRNGKVIRLTKKEFSLLEYMIRNKGLMLSRAIIMERVWTADSDPFSNTVEAHIRNLRKKINAGRRPDLIANVSGHGYILDNPDQLIQYRR